MTEVAPVELKKALENQHGGIAHFVHFVPVTEMHGSETVWNRTVAVFDLKSSLSGCNRAYAWSYETEGGKRRFFAVAAIVAEQRGRS